MTKQECERPFAMMKANWPFLDFGDETTAGIWYEALKQYDEPEVRQGIMDAIANLQKTTPQVADVLEFVKAVHNGTRRMQAEADSRRGPAASVSCKKCNDYGWITIIYPTGYEAVRACDCSAAYKAFGEKALRAQQEQPPVWWTEMMFGANEIPSQYQLIRVSRQLVNTGDKWHDRKTGQDLERQKWGYAPYFPDGQRREVIMAYQKRVR